MKISYATLLEAYRQISKKRLLCATALVSFLAGSFIANQVTRADQVSANNNRVFELLVYHPTPGKEPALESIFRDVAKLQKKHDLEVIGYWVPDDESGWPNTFIYLVAHPSREKAKANWAALHADPAFPQYRKAAAEILEKADNKYRVDEVYMRPTDFSALK
jgi:hypothetical protein